MTNTPTQSPPDVEGLVKRLQMPLFGNEDRIMRHWDRWRKMHAEGFGGSLTRDEFEAFLSDVDDERTEAAAFIRTSDEARVRAEGERDDLWAERDKLALDWTIANAAHQAAEARIKALSDVLREIKRVAQIFDCHPVFALAERALSSAPPPEDALAKAVGKRS